MANLIYLKLTGKNQGLISAGCSTRDSIGNMFCTTPANALFDTTQTK